VFVVLSIGYPEAVVLSWPMIRIAVAALVWTRALGPCGAGRLPGASAPGRRAGQ